MARAGMDRFLDDDFYWDFSHTVEIEAIHGATVPVLLERITGSKEGERDRARHLIGRLGGSIAWSLARAAAHGEPRLRIAAAKALLLLPKGTWVSAGPLVTAFRSEDAELSAAAGEALATVGDSMARWAMVGVLEDEGASFEVRRRAAVWLTPIADWYYAENALKRAAKSRDEGLREAARKALAEAARKGK